MKQLERLFSYQGNSIRVIMMDGEPWWIAKDVCNVLEINNHRDAIGRLDDDEKGVVLTDTLGGLQEMTAINEPGLYSLILRSRKQEAKAFKRWITHEVIPSIRKKGGYGTPILPTSQKRPQNKLRQAEKMLKMIKENKEILTPEAHHAILSQATELITGKPLTPIQRNPLALPEPKKQYIDQYHKPVIDTIAVTEKIIGPIWQLLHKPVIHEEIPSDLIHWWKKMLRKMNKEDVELFIEVIVEEQPQAFIQNTNPIHELLQNRYQEITRSYP